MHHNNDYYVTIERYIRLNREKNVWKGLFFILLLWDFAFLIATTL